MKALVPSLLAGLFLYGCASDESPGDRPMAGDEVAIDPVSDAEVRTDSEWNTYWNEHWYYFESRETQRQFESNPASYVGDDGRIRKERQMERYKVSPHQVR